MRLRSLFAGLLVGVLSGGVSGPANPAALADGTKALNLPLALRTLLQASMTQSTTAPGARLLPNAGSGADHGYLRPDGRRVEAQSRRQAVIQLLKEAATRHHLDPSLVLALSYWESAWDESRVSSTGAIGLMQVQPQVAAVDGPLLLARDVDLRDVYDNADLGAAILKANLEAYGSKEVALAAYYQGGPSLEQDGPYPDTQQYVLGILALAAQIAAGQLPS